VFAGGGEKVVFSGGAGLGYGRENASTGGGDLLVGGSGDALLVFGSAVASEDEMRVGVDKAGCYGFLIRIDQGCFERDSLLKFGVGSGSGDAVVFDDQRGAGDDGEVAKLPADARACGTG
jgi:hypothetical protein